MVSKESMKLRHPSTLVQQKIHLQLYRSNKLIQDATEGTCSLHRGPNSPVSP